VVGVAGGRSCRWSELPVVGAAGGRSCRWSELPVVGAGGRSCLWSELPVVGAACGRSCLVGAAGGRSCRWSELPVVGAAWSELPVVGAAGRRAAVGAVLLDRRSARVLTFDAPARAPTPERHDPPPLSVRARCSPSRKELPGPPRRGALDRRGRCAETVTSARATARVLLHRSTPRRTHQRPGARRGLRAKRLRGRAPRCKVRNTRSSRRPQRRAPRRARPPGTGPVEDRRRIEAVHDHLAARLQAMCGADLRIELRRRAGAERSGLGVRHQPADEPGIVDRPDVPIRQGEATRSGIRTVPVMLDASSSPSSTRRRSTRLVIRGPYDFGEPFAALRE